MKSNYRYLFSKSLVLGFVCIGLLTACDVNKSENSSLNGQSGCAGVDGEYVANWFLPGQSGEALDAYDKNYTREEVRQRVVCDIGGMINSKLNQGRADLSQMALGFAKKAALRFLDGYTGGLASSFFGGPSSNGGSAGPNVEEIKKAVEQVINDAFDKSENRTLDTQYKAFLDRFDSYRAYAGVTSEAGRVIPPFKTLYDMKISGSADFSELYRERYEKQLDRLTELQGLATDLLNVSRFETDFRGKAEFKLAKPFQLVLGIFASVSRDIKGGDISNIVDNHLQRLVRMEKAIAAYAWNLPYSDPAGVSNVYEALRLRSQFVEGQYRALADQYLGANYDAFVIEMSRVTGKPAPSRTKFPYSNEGTKNNGNVRLNLKDGSFSGTMQVSSDAYYGSRATGFSDLNGDGLADFFVVNDNGAYVRLNLRYLNFGPTIQVTSDAFYGSRATGFADLNADGFADFYVVNDDGAYVRYNNRNNSFGSTVRLTNDAYYGTKATGFADINGDGFADFYVVNDSQAVVRYFNGQTFTGNVPLTSDPFYGTKSTGFADINGDGLADFIVVNESESVVRYNQSNNSFGGNVHMTRDPYYGSFATGFADLNGDRFADFFVVN